MERAELYKYFIEENHSREDTAKHFGVTDGAIKAALRKYGIKKSKSNSLKSRYEIKVTKDEVYKYYIEENHTREECLRHFNTSLATFKRWLSVFHIKKEKLKLKPTPIKKEKVKKIKTKKPVKHKDIKLETMVKEQSDLKTRFTNLLVSGRINYIINYSLGSFQYDFKVDNILIEINPYSTHSSIEKDYHLRKSNVAKENGYHCIHIWDWDNIDAIINLLKRKEESIGARKCIVKEVSVKEARSFLNKYHIQGYAKDDIRLGLYHGSELVSIMTFGKPRYNKNFEYELVRYCSSINVTGGSSRLFKHFLNKYKPKSICSYCDLSKFKGETYSLLGFKLRSISSPAVHWYNGHRHITDNLLRQWGFDNLFNTSYGKGTSNRDLMLSHGFVEIYDCGQATYEYYEQR